jgi:glycogenin glucosyltransferase
MRQGERLVARSSNTTYTNRSEPPVDAVPEAANFPTEQYVFSQSHDLFKPPQSYPAPPQDMWYKVPDEKPKPAERPKPIFPWEREENRPKATRVFAEDFPPQPIPAPAPAMPELPSPTHPFSTVHYEADGSPKQAAPGIGSPPRVSSPKTSEEHWQEFQQSSTNAWDSVPGIDTYVRAIMDNQTRRGKPQVLRQDRPDEILSPTISRKNRRESLILTDFPTAMERPSLPVTPAPVARPTFWGEERDDRGDLPPAEGVPPQSQWVCPQCGFSSVSETDFHGPPRAPPSSIPIPATAAPPPTVTVEEVEESPQPQLESIQETKQLSPLSSPLESRPGNSLRGAPLVSLTDPALLVPHEHVPGPDANTVSASISAFGPSSVAASIP